MKTGVGGRQEVLLWMKGYIGKAKNRGKGDGVATSIVSQMLMKYPIRRAGGWTTFPAHLKLRPITIGAPLSPPILPNGAAITKER